MIGFPLLLIPVAICNIIVFLMPDLSLAGPVELFSITLPSLDVIRISLKDVLVSLSILLLLLEVMRAARPASKYFTDHLLSLLVAAGAAYEFVMLPKFGNATFFTITLVAFVDFFAGVSLRARRPRRVAAPVYAEPAPHYHPAPVAPAPVPAAVTPAPAPVTPAAPVPPATSVAESVLSEKAEPKLERIEPRIEPKIETPVAPEVVAHTSPQITSPDLQPDGSTPEKPKN
ncbi:hypothetical protein RPMA_05070 [Tardiphaga alba]|uniref:Uncharacterized protein n=1 Tax=Tardiphaga alba TaxID=340268 RepID=A0ABX8A724_9BRAD|nr:hypothetical protein [Tardiphaga alba]QUS38283.1 hypothetical protein RPMA_05070 [Tardiphaga alba]